MPVHDCFTATEFVTMVPLADASSAGARLWDANAEWVRRLCGSARPWAGASASQEPGLLERLLPGALEPAIRSWKRKRFLRRRGAEALAWPDVVLEPGRLKQHDASHRREILGRFRARLAELQLDDSWVEPAS